jgi:hypothetical protein
MRFPMPRRLVFGIATLLSLFAWATRPAPAPDVPSQAVYDQNPDHLWNRLYRQFYVRWGADGSEYGDDELDPLLWGETKYLRRGPSHEQAIRVLDEFLSKHGEKLITDPLKHAVLQRDLWAIFEWLSAVGSPQAADKKLAEKIVAVMRRLALPRREIESLGDTYAAAIAAETYAARYDPRHPETAFLPVDVFGPGGEWVCLGTEDGQGAPAHTRFFGGRSVFLVFLRLPGGRQATLDYLKQIAGFPNRLIRNPGGFYPLLRHGNGSAGAAPDALVPNPDLPQFPPGTEVALVRRMVLIDEEGELVPSNLTESVQIRAFREMPSRADWLAGRSERLQDVFEFRLSRRQLFAGQSGGLRAITPDDRGLSQFLTMPMDPLEMHFESQPQRVLQSCEGCHGAPGIQSMLSPRTIWGEPNGSATALLASSPADQTASTIAWKRKQANWSALKDLWKYIASHARVGATG